MFACYIIFLEANGPYCLPPPMSGTHLYKAVAALGAVDAQFRLHLLAAFLRQLLPLLHVRPGETGPGYTI